MRKCLSVFMALVILFGVISPTVVSASVITETVNVYFYADGVKLQSLLAIKGEGITASLIPTPPAKDGYEFLGWSVAENDAGGVVPVQEIAERSYSKDTNWYAVWKWVIKPYDSEKIYTSDIFWEYPKSLSSNYWLSTFNNSTYSVYSNIIHEYIKTKEFTMSAIERGLDIALSPEETIKYYSDRIGLSNFEFNAELDKANQAFLEAVCDMDTSGVNALSSDNKFLKNLNKFYETVQKIEEYAVKHEAKLNKLDKPELYKTFAEQSTEMLKRYCTQVEPKLPSLNSRIYTSVSEATELLGTVTDALDFVEAWALSIVIQETQMEIIDDIMNNIPKECTLYKGLSRLQNQLKGGFLTYFGDTYIKDKIYSKIMGKAADVIKGAAFGSVAAVPAAVVAVVKLGNKLMFDVIFKVDYYDYLAAGFATEYSKDMVTCVKNKAAVFEKQFTSQDLKDYKTLFDALICTKKAALESCKSIAKFNDTFTDTYVDTSLKNLFPDDPYQDFIDTTKEYIGAFSPENRNQLQHVPYDIVIPQGEEYALRRPSDDLLENSVYIRGARKGAIIMNDNAKLNLTDSFEIEKLTANGTVYSDDGYTLTVDTAEAKNQVVFQIPLICNKWMKQSGNFEANEDLTLQGDIQMSGTFTQSNDKKFELHGDLLGNGTVSLGNVLLAGKAAQMIDCPVTALSFTNDNTSYGGVTLKQAVTVNGPVSSEYRLNGGQNLVLTGDSSFTDDCFNGSVTVNSMTGELPKQIMGKLYLTGDVTQKSDSTFNGLNIKSGTFSLNGGNVAVNGNAELSGGNLTLIDSDFSVKGIWVVPSSQSAVTMDDASKVTVKGDSSITGSISGGTLVTYGDLYNNGTVGPNVLEVYALSPATYTGNNISVTDIKVAAPSILHLNNILSASRNYSVTGNVDPIGNVRMCGQSQITEDKTFRKPLTVDGNLVLDGATVIAENNVSIQNGDLILKNGAKLVVRGGFFMNGSGSKKVMVDETSSIIFEKLSIFSSVTGITVDGKLTFIGDTSFGSAALTGSGKIEIRNDWFANGSVNFQGELSVTGKIIQTVSVSSGACFGKILISNPSKSGVLISNTMYYTEEYQNQNSRVRGTITKK